MVLSEKSRRFAAQYREITENPRYLSLKEVPRHGSTNTYDHSVRVAFLAYTLAPKLHIDADSAARVGLLHDFCFVDYHKKDPEVERAYNGRWYCFYHPEDAVKNAEAEGYRLSQAEKKAIWSHMFPLSTSIPSSRLACLLTFSDKCVALEESLANAGSGCRHAGGLVRHGYLRALRFTGFYKG